MSKLIQDLKEIGDYLRHQRDHITANKVFQAVDRIKGLELDLGLMELARDQQAGLLKSCEQALNERDGA